ncbi:MAG: alanine--glyoxylate aminotransferase family protein [Anaerolineae bacterium]|uniref:pyridoxal-phosphate-dependent aminotransferase family protein n=1 Tax=Promineifilum sp. TaxID=2664178 RepID=UPI001DCF95CE|nr:alanine--glyoxylate aminotransferase family protein [Anaerolineales bacterium]MCO5180668.1 alanine--glyoxylate aminotransferase family protein [Promineifilum sp.]MCW5847880.1 alanine--glyoxylate aminotransferase family protein [Anaerolineae bacterium]
MSIDTFAINDNHRLNLPTLDMPPRILLGAGPSNSHPRVLAALIAPTVGHLDPTFIRVMDEVGELLRYAWQTDNAYTIAISGTGSAAMEAAFANVVEPGDRVLVAVNGYFGRRMVDMAGRYGGDVRCLEAEWGRAFRFEDIEQGLETHRPQVLALVQAETSTGVGQPLDGLAELCRAHDCLLLVDTVTSLGGAPLFVDAWGIDIAYSGSQKCLSAPSGLSPLTFGPRALDKIAGRRVPIANWYMNADLLGKYWAGSPRAYHHTAPMHLFYALREGLRLVAEEGLAERWARHQTIAETLWAGLEEIGLSPYVAREFRLPSLTTVRVPDGVDAAAVSRRLLAEYNIEIAGGLGELAGKVWRVGHMGYNARRETVAVLLRALGKVLER